MAAIYSVGGFTKTITVPVTVTAAAYATGNLIGGKITLAGATRNTTDGGGTNSAGLNHLRITDKANQKIPLDVVFFNADPANTTFTDHAAVALNVADLPKVVGHVSLVATDYVSLAAATNAVATARNVGMAFSLAANATTLYACLIARGSGTYTSTSDIELLVGLWQD